MKQTSNKDMLNAIRNQASTEYQERIPVITDDRIETYKMVQDTLDNYPTVKNEFINTLVNKVVRTDFFSKIYDNPLKMLKKGSLAYGTSIEELFVIAAESKGFYKTDSHWNEANKTQLNIQQVDEANELSKIEKPDVRALYITRNFAHVFKTTISDAQLKGAFTSQNGLSELVNQIVGSLENGAEQEEFSNMKTLLKSVASQKVISTDGGGKVKPLTAKTVEDDNIPMTYASQTEAQQKQKKNGVLQAMYKYNVDKHVGTKGQVAQNLAIAIRSLAGRLKFVSTKYNMAGVPTWSRPEDLVFLTTPEIMAELDVNILAEAFNVSKAELNVRTILVDELPTQWYRGALAQGETTGDVGYYYKKTNQSAGQPQTGSEGGQTLVNTITNEDKGGICYGILMDKSFIQAIDTVNEARQFENGRTLSTNLFLHRQGILANCYFANCIALFDEKGYKNVNPLQPA